LGQLVQWIVRVVRRDIRVLVRLCRPVPRRINRVYGTVFAYDYRGRRISVTDGRVLFDQSLLRRSLQASEDCGSSQARAQLTEREKLVLSHIFEGLANKQIGDRLRISESAVKACLQQLFAKTGVRTRSQLVRIALEQYRDQI
jgi:DNA-binding CsgD family transcriptional regulator